MTFRKNLGSFFTESSNASEEIIKIINRENKKNKVNLVVIELNFETITEELEKYLINLNKKVLIISKNKLKFTNNFIYREETLDDKKKPFVIAGGVAANETIRKTLRELSEKMNFDPIYPSKEFCGDNAAMIAWAGIQRYKKKLLNTEAALKFGDFVMA